MFLLILPGAVQQLAGFEPLISSSVVEGSTTVLQPLSIEKKFVSVLPSLCQFETHITTKIRNYFCLLNFSQSILPGAVQQLTGFEPFISSSVVEGSTIVLQPLSIEKKFVSAWPSLCNLKDS
jgi:hypothetical protein